MIAVDRVAPDNALRNILRRVPPNSVLYYPGLDWANWHSNTILDYSGRRNNGTISGAVQKRLPSGLWYLDYDGTDDYVSCADVADWDLGTGDFTLLCWFRNDANYVAATNDGRRLICAGPYVVGGTSWNWGHGWHAGWNGQGNPCYNFVSFQGNPIVAEDKNSSTIASMNTTGVWMCGGLSMIGGTLNFFHNGAAQGTGVTARSLDCSALGLLVGARYNDGVGARIEFHNGGLDLKGLVKGVGWTAARHKDWYNGMKPYFV